MNNKKYFKEYYKKNYQYFYDYNHNRPSTRKNYIGIEIDGIIYCFPTKKSIKFIKVVKEDLEQENFKLIKTK